jgi:hypothetical protein
VAFSEFFKDASAEIEKLGTIIRFLTCCNREAHLRGNVYIQLANERDALRACRNLSGRWFGGKRLQPCFVDIANWKNAICGKSMFESYIVAYLVKQCLNTIQS